MTEDRLIEIANYYVDTKVPMSELSKKFKISKTSLVRYFNGERQIKLPCLLQKSVNEIKSKNWIDGKSTSGNKGNKKLSDEEIIKLAKLYSKGEFTLKELALPFNVSPATLYNNFTIELLGSELYESVKNVYEQNKGAKRR